MSCRNLTHSAGILETRVPQSRSRCAIEVLTLVSDLGWGSALKRRCRCRVPSYEDQMVGVGLARTAYCLFVDALTRCSLEARLGALDLNASRSTFEVRALLTTLSPMRGRKLDSDFSPRFEGPRRWTWTECASCWKQSGGTWGTARGGTNYSTRLCSATFLLLAHTDSAQTPGNLACSLRRTKQ